MYDDDNSGMIDQTEMANVMLVSECDISLHNLSYFLQSLYKMLEGMGCRPSGDPKIRARDIFSIIDVNNDGTLSEEEFVKGNN